MDPDNDVRLLGVAPVVVIGTPRPATEAATTSACIDWFRWKSMRGREESSSGVSLTEGTYG